MPQEIILNHLTMSEYAKYKDELPRQDWDHYKELVKRMFQIKEFYFFEDELLKSNNAKSMDELLSTHPDSFIPAGLKNKHLKKFKGKNLLERADEMKKIREKMGDFSEKDFEKTWFDIFLPKFNITPKEPYYDEFFIYQLRNLDLLSMDDFLYYQLVTYFENDIGKYKRFVSLSLRKHGEKLMLSDQIKTVDEWVNMIEMKPELSGVNETESSITKKARVKRDAGDNITSLNLAQTAYLINLLKESKVIIKDDIILTSKTAGEAFSLLTGYSPDTLRLKMNLKGQNELTYNDRKTVREMLYSIMAIIDKEISEQKGKKP